MGLIADNFSTITARMGSAAGRAGRDVRAIKLVAVSKTVGVPEISAAIDCGIRDFGENRVQDLVLKKQLFPDVRWHMIGRLQTNKVKDVLGAAAIIHSLDRWDLAEYIEKRAQRELLTVPVLIQVNMAGEASKGGIAPANVEEFVGALSQLHNIRVVGLMTMAPAVSDPEETRPIFRETAGLFRHLKDNNYPNVSMDILSMGMTHDFEIAIEEGSNLVRVGRGIFGPRKEEGYRIGNA